MAKLLGLSHTHINNTKCKPGTQSLIIFLSLFLSLLLFKKLCLHNMFSLFPQPKPYFKRVSRRPENSPFSTIQDDFRMSNINMSSLKWSHDNHTGWVDSMSSLYNSFDAPSWWKCSRIQPGPSASLSLLTLQSSEVSFFA